MMNDDKLKDIIMTVDEFREYIKQQFTGINYEITELPVLKISDIYNPRNPFSVISTSRVCEWIMVNIKFDLANNAIFEIPLYMSEDVVGIIVPYEHSIKEIHEACKALHARYNE